MAHDGPEHHWPGRPETESPYEPGGVPSILNWQAQLQHTTPAAPVAEKMADLPELVAWDLAGDGEESLEVQGGNCWRSSGVWDLRSQCGSVGMSCRASNWLTLLACGSG